jgi:hypothetical protein
MTMNRTPEDHITPHGHGRRNLIIAAVVVVVAAVIVAVILVVNRSDSRSASYRLGYVYGRDLVAPKLGNVDRDGRVGCQRLVTDVHAMAQDRTLTVHAKDVSLKPGDLSAADFMTGCLDGVKSAA